MIEYVDFSLDPVTITNTIYILNYKETRAAIKDWLRFELLVFIFRFHLLPRQVPRIQAGGSTKLSSFL